MCICPYYIKLLKAKKWACLCVCVSACVHVRAPIHTHKCENLPLRQIFAGSFGSQVHMTLPYPPLQSALPSPYSPSSYPPNSLLLPLPTLTQTTWMTLENKEGKQLLCSLHLKSHCPHFCHLPNAIFLSISPVAFGAYMIVCDVFCTL